MTGQRKVFAYVTRGDRPLVFMERDFEEGGIQVPAGSPRDGETLEEAVLREVEEETGLTSLRIVRFLGDCRFDNAVWGLDSVHHRFFYHVECEEDAPETWSHEEKETSAVTKDTHERIIFDFRWARIPDGIPELQKGHGRFLPELFESVQEEKKEHYRA